MFEYAKARSRVAAWVLKNKDKGQPFRLKEICYFRGRENDKSIDNGYLAPIDQLMSIKTAHKIISELVDRDLLRPTISATKVEQYLPLVDGNEKRWQRMVASQGTIRYACTVSRRWFVSKLAAIFVWIMTVLAAALVKDFFLGRK